MFTHSWVQLTLPEGQSESQPELWLSIKSEHYASMSTPMSAHKALSNIYNTARLPGKYNRHGSISKSIGSK